jgi:hypothetical protein
MPADLRDHAHTLNAGMHSFPFRLTLPSDLPATLRTFSGAAAINYKLKATVLRAGFGSVNWTAKKIIHIARGLQPDAIEFNSTVDLGPRLPRASEV